MTGGHDSGRERLSSTEVYKEGRAWREAGELPGARQALRGVSLGDRLFMTGGKDPSDSDLTSVLVWQPDTESWLPAGNMAEGRRHHAVTAVSATFIRDHCDG